jgi:predicted methyltransferase
MYTKNNVETLKARIRDILHEKLLKLISNIAEKKKYNNMERADFSTIKPLVRQPLKFAKLQPP